GRIVVDSKIFGEIVRKLPNSEIILESQENNILNIHCQKSDFELVHMNADEFPKLPKINENEFFSVPQGTLKNMIKGTSFAVAQDETRPILTGVLFEVKEKTLNLVALDGIRLALRSEILDTENTISAVIPGKTLNEVAKILEESEDIVNITFTTNHILFNLGVTKIISRLLEGEFINYSSIIPQEHKLNVTVKRQELQSCIERASLMAKDGNSNLIKLDIQPDNLIITSNSQLGKVREEVSIELQGESLQIAFNSKYLIDILKITEEEEVVLEFTSAVSPCIIKHKNTQNCEYLVLPVRLVK
ncbi:DNA polymerase III subunit beta, partial [Clostridium sp.]|uniref:DNA polymerase III subunit beta n=1 Tax=Clostridium sp. TaxID=1506 RepID=UPI003464B09D